MMSEDFARTGKLVKFVVRQDWIKITLWLIGITFFTLIVPLAFEEMYDTQQERDTFAETMKNPAMTAMVGRGDLDNYTIGAITAHEMLLFTAIAVGLMSILLVNRHTRVDEEDGRIELVRSLPVGRLAYLNATLIVYIITNVLLILMTGFGLYALGIESMNLEGSLLYGVALGATGIFFASLTALFAQITESSRGTLGFSIAFLLIVYLIRAVGDVSNEALSWFSPLGWVTKAEAYSSNHWWPVLLMVMVSIVLITIASYLNAIRDLGAGFLPQNPGRENATRFLQSPLSLAVRIQRVTLISWAVGMFVLGVSYGSVFGDLDSFFEGNEILEQMIIPEEGFTFTEQFLPMLMIVMSILATIPTLISLLKIHGEEKKGRIDPILGGTVSRTKLLGSYLLISVLTGFFMVSLAAIGLWVSAVSVMEDPLSFGTIYNSAIIYYPAVLVMIGLTMLLIGYVPKISSLIWIYVFYTFFVLYLGGLLDVPDWLSKLTPFGYISQLPIEEVEWSNLMILTVLAALLMVGGMIGYNKRDIE